MNTIPVDGLPPGRGVVWRAVSPSLSTKPAAGRYRGRCGVVNADEGSAPQATYQATGFDGETFGRKKGGRPTGLRNTRTPGTVALPGGATTTTRPGGDRDQTHPFA